MMNPMDEKLESVLKRLTSVGFSAIPIDSFKKIVEDGISSPHFSAIISWLSQHIKKLYNLECFINATTGPEDVEFFLLEVSSFLREIACVTPSLMKGSLNERFLHFNNKLKLIDVLVTELQGAMLTAAHKEKPAVAQTIVIPESPTAKHLKQILVTLNFKKPPPTVTSLQIFTKIQEKISLLQAQLPPKHSFHPLFTGTLTEKQWYQLGNIQKEFHEEYRFRREMLITRVNVTIKSFFWSDRLKNAEKEAMQICDKYMKTMSIEPSVKMASLLSADQDLLVVERTSSAIVRQNTRSQVNKVLIGEVPDRGGRPEELQPPPPEVPSWQQMPSGQNTKSNIQGANSNKGATYSRSDDRNKSFSNRNTAGSGDVTRNTRDSGYKVSGDASHGGAYSRNAYNEPAYGYSDNAYGNNFNRGGGNVMGFVPNQMRPFDNYANAGNVGPQFYNPPIVQAPGPFQSSFGVGIGGYSAAGGDFQRYSGSPMTYSSDRGRSSAGGGSRRGRGGRGGRRGY